MTSITKVGMALLLPTVLAACVGPLPVIDTSATPDDIARIPLKKAPAKPEAKGDTYYDPNSAGAGLYDTHKHQDDALGPYFKVSDFSRTGDVGFRYARMDTKIINCLSRVRRKLQIPMTIKSSYRTWQYNDQLVKEGKPASSKSYHMSGKAVDVHVKGVSTGELVKTVYSKCGCGAAIGIGSGWYHIDTRGTSTRPWGYGASTSFGRSTARKIHKAMCGGGSSDTNETVAQVLDGAKSGFATIKTKIEGLFK